MSEARRGFLEAGRRPALRLDAFPTEDATGAAEQAAGKGPQQVVYAADASEDQDVLQPFNHQCDSGGHQCGLQC